MVLEELIRGMMRQHLARIERDGGRNVKAIENVRAELEDRVFHPSRYDRPPAFLRDVPPNQITEDYEALWVAANGLWQERQAIVDRVATRQRLDNLAWFGVGTALGITLLCMVETTLGICPFM